MCLCVGERHMFSRSGFGGSAWVFSGARVESGRRLGSAVAAELSLRFHLGCGKEKREWTH